jgi:hypothetical protein
MVFANTCHLQDAIYMKAGFALFKDWVGAFIHVGTILQYGRKQSDLDVSYSKHIQGDTGENINIFRSDIIGHFEKKSSYEHVSTSE